MQSDCFWVERLTLHPPKMLPFEKLLVDLFSLDLWGGMVPSWKVSQNYFSSKMNSFWEWEVAGKKKFPQMADYWLFFCSLLFLAFSPGLQCCFKAVLAHTRLLKAQCKAIFILLRFPVPILDNLALYKANVGQVGTVLRLSVPFWRKFCPSQGSQADFEAV